METKNYILKSNPLWDTGEYPWIIYDEATQEKAFASNDDIEALGTTDEERFEARRGHDVRCSTIALDYLGGIYETSGY